MNTEQTSRAGVYSRVSTDEQAHEGYSLAEQERRALELIERERWQYVTTYQDAGFSGSDLNRPAYRQLLDDVAAGALDVVIVTALDRFGRDAGELRSTLLLLDAAGVKLASLHEHIDRATPEGRLQTGILGEFAEFEREKGRARTKAGIRSRAISGKPWGAPPYGYRKTDDGHWQPEPAEVPIAARIWEERVEQGRSYQDIAARLNRDGIHGRTGGHWTATTIRKILTGRYMLGYFAHGGEWIKGTHSALVDEDTWLAAQVLAQKGKRYAPSRGGRKPKLHLCTGAILRCSVCHEAMLPRSDRDTYICRTNKQIKGAGSCPMSDQDRATVDINVVHAIEEMFIDLDATRDRVARDLDAYLAATEAAAQRAERERAEKTAQRERVERDYLAGELGGASYERLSERLSEELSALDAQCDRGWPSTSQRSAKAR